MIQLYVKNSLVSFIVFMVLFSGVNCSNKDNPVQDENKPPFKPVNDIASGSPPSSSTSQSLNSKIYWQCSDPDGDALTYDVYFGKSSNPPIVSNNQSGSSYSPGTLEYSTRYYWKIRAKDKHEVTQTSDIWYFTTLAEPTEYISTPNTPSGADTGFVNQDIPFSTGGSSSNLGHTVQYSFSWGDGNNSVWSYSTSASHVWSDPGTYFIRAQARCATHTSVLSNYSNAKTIRILESAPEGIEIPLGIPLDLDFSDSGDKLLYFVNNSPNSYLTFSLDWAQGNDLCLWINFPSSGDYPPYNGAGRDADYVGEYGWGRKIFDSPAELGTWYIRAVDCSIDGISSFTIMADLSEYRPKDFTELPMETPVQSSTLDGDKLFWVRISPNTQDKGLIISTTQTAGDILDLGMNLPSTNKYPITALRADIYSVTASGNERIVFDPPEGQFQTGDYRIIVEQYGSGGSFTIEVGRIGTGNNK